MKIVTILGSPRSKGNSATIARQLADTAKDLGAETAIYELNQLSYRGCQGCHACKTTLDHCVLKDDLTEVLDAVRTADAVVLATPVYFGDVTGQYKTYLDRTFSYFKPDFLTNSSPSRLEPKKLVFILTQGNPDEKIFADVFQRNKMFLTMLGFNDIRLIRACGLVPGVAVPEGILQQAEEAAHSLMR